MSMAYWISGIVVGVIFGLGLALRLTAYCVMKSNDYGDTSGSSYRSRSVSRPLLPDIAGEETGPKI